MTSSRTRLLGGRLCLVVLPLLTSPLLGQTIVGSDHDFSGKNWSTGRICEVCHAPHDQDLAAKYGAVGLLWNHKLSSATYTMYSSPTLDGTIDSQPTGVTRMCLGCHDGTVAVDSFGPHAGGTKYLTGGERVPGTSYWSGGVGDLSSTHPLSIVYDDTKDPGLAPKTATMGSSGTIADVLEGGKVQCHSCHDVHNNEVQGKKLLRVNNDKSGLCLTCHLK